jgi:Flp pilus assembly protein TadG
VNVRRQRGIAIIEFALSLPIMLILLFTVIEFGRAVLTRQVLINVSREAANLSARGTPLDESARAVQLSASPLDLRANGYVILTQVFRNAGGALIIQKQFADGRRPRASHVGTGVGSPARLPATAVEVPARGTSMFVAEVFYLEDTITPLTRFVTVALGDTFYDVAFF